MVTNGHNSDEAPELEESLQMESSGSRESMRAGMSSILGLEQSSALGYSFNALQIMAKGSFDAAEWLGMTEYTDREIQIMALRYARRHRARYGNSRLDLVDWKKALMRISRNRAGRAEIERMFIAERQRLGEEDSQKNRNRFERMLGTGGNDGRTKL